MSETLVIGHRNPDTDAICSAIAYAEFKRLIGMRDVVAARCGETNERIDFVLRHFGIPAPRFVSDVAPRVRDVMQSNVISVPPRTSMVDALTMMDQRNIRVLPVLDADRRCLGLLSIFKATKYFVPSTNRVFDSRRILSSVRMIARTLGSKMICAFEPDEEQDLVLMLAAMKATSFSTRLSNYAPEKLVVVVGDREDIQRIAIQGRVRVVIVTGGLEITTEIHDLARRNEVTLMISPHDSATTAMLCRASIPVSRLLREDFLRFHDDERLADIQPVAAASQFQTFPIEDADGRVVGILSKSDFLKPVNRKLILVDHNELTQAVQGAEQLEILEVIDHHRLGAFSTAQPILFRNEPVGSTCTIVADLFLRHGITPTPGIAGIMLAGLVTDTLNLTSPTSTQRDAEILAWLEKQAGVNARDFTEKVFSSGSVLVSQPAEKAITADCKEYVEVGQRFSVAQIEELGFDAFWKRAADVRAALDRHRERQGLYFAALFITDVVQQTSLLMVAGPSQLVDSIAYPEVVPGVFQMDGVVSRKKQLLPYLTAQLRQVSRGDM